MAVDDGEPGILHEHQHHGDRGGLDLDGLRRRRGRSFGWAAEAVPRSRSCCWVPRARVRRAPVQQQLRPRIYRLRYAFRSSDVRRPGDAVLRKVADIIEARCSPSRGDGAVAAWVFRRVGHGREAGSASAAPAPCGGRRPLPRVSASTSGWPGPPDLEGVHHQPGGGPGRPRSLRRVGLASRRGRRCELRGVRLAAPFVGGAVREVRSIRARLVLDGR